MKAIAPGKIILSGEHAVVHGAPAIALAVQQYATVKTTSAAETLPRTHTPFGESTLSSDGEADALYQELHARYQSFMAGDLPIANVMPDKQQFVQLGWLLLRNRMPEKVKGGVSITATSELPLGSGMGSSAAIAAALGTSLADFHQIDLTPDACFQFAMELESYQHGHPSGVDPYLAVHGGAVWYRRDCAPEPLSLPALNLCIIQTGRPESTTGECVAQVRETHATSGLWRDFEAVCERVRASIGSETHTGLVDAVRTNHRLLVEIGVVPEPIQQLVSHIEELGGAAKICGAGSIRGDAAGILWVVGDEARAALPELGFSPIAMEGDPHGARIVD